MKLHIASLMILCLALMALPGWADYNNGPINGNIDAWTINFGFIVSDTFVADSSQVTGFTFGAREFPGDSLLTVDWSITSGENSGTVFGSGTANVTDKFVSTNQFGYQIDLITVTGLNVATVSGTQYWLNLQNAVTKGGEVAFWDENSGVGCTSPGCPSKASESALGTIPSEAFTINTGGGTTPEPGSFLLFGSGVLGLAGVLRRKLL
jgi:hypothetical protein